jgi:hypothetical protein
MKISLRVIGHKEGNEKEEEGNQTKGNNTVIYYQIEVIFNSVTRIISRRFKLLSNFKDQLGKNY